MDKTEIGIFIGLAWVSILTLVMLLIFFYQNYRTKIIKVEREKQLVEFKAAVDAEEKQKERIANNLHDEVLPLIAAFVHRIDLHIRNIENNALTKEELEEDYELINQITLSMRSIAMDLIPVTLLNFGLVKTFEYYAKQLNKGEKAVEFANEMKLKELTFSKNDQVNIYRLCMELFNNLRKHADFSYLKILFQNDEKGLYINVSHNGKGVTNQGIEVLTKTSKGLGLKSMQARLLILRGTINYSVGSDLSSVTLYVPFQK